MYLDLERSKLVMFSLRESYDTHPNPFIFIKNERRVMSSEVEGLSALEKNAVIRPQRAILPSQSGVTFIPCNSPLQIKMTVWRTFFKI